MTGKAKIQVSGALHLNRGGHGYLGSGRVQLLELIRETGSISQAAKRMGMSYKAAWEAVEAMNNLAEKPLVERSTGGYGGGGTVVTTYGERVVESWHVLEGEYHKFIARAEESITDFGQIDKLLRAFDMKTSARNQYRGRITHIQKGAVNGEVKVDLGEGLAIFAIVTNEAVEELRLDIDREVVVLIKSSFVILAPDEGIRISARNRLCGTVTEVITGAVNGEVKLELPGGRMLTAVVTNEAIEELGLVPGNRACALVKAAHVILAVND